MSIIDTHFHIWDPTTRDHSWLAAVPWLSQTRHYSICEYAEVAGRNRVRGGVLVQVLNDLDETREFLALAAAQPSVLGVVGWVDLEAIDVADTIAMLREGPGGDLLVGIRHLVQGEPDPAYMERPTVLNGLRAVADAGLVFDLLVSERQIRSALNGINQVEGLRVVLDHAGKPRVDAGPTEPWTTLMREFASRGHVTCKLSGLVTEAGTSWSPGRLAPFVTCALSAFGPEQVMFGSDWPVFNGLATYQDVLQIVTSAIADMNRSERQAVMAGTAVRTYGLAPLLEPGPARFGPVDPSIAA
jgi:L-fuconolactonase